MRSRLGWPVTVLLLPILGSGCGVSNAGGQGGNGPAATAGVAASSVTNSIKRSPNILVDQLGYRPGDTKVAVIRNPKVGYDASDSFSPGKTYQVRAASDGAVIFSGSPAAWNGGAVEASSGDSGWWFDFSTVALAGDYFVYDVSGNVRSATFTIDQQVYKKGLKAAARVYFYQRSGSSNGGGAKKAANAGACWADDPAYLGSKQDSQAHDATDQGNDAKVHDLSGGWFDAGDTNKYVTFAASAVHQLLTAFQNNPGVFTDDFNIPESGNGIPDLIDEVKYETDWLKKMQFSADGSVALKVGSLGFPPASPPSSDTTARYYVPSCTSSTIAAAGMFAHASYVYSKIPALAGEAADLKSRAIRAWGNYESIPSKQEHCDTQVVKSGNADWKASDQQGEAVVAAVYLYAITGEAGYTSYLKYNYNAAKSYHDIGWSRYTPQEGEALLFYASLPNADSGLRGTILANKLSDVNNGSQIYGFNAKDDLYRNYLHDAQYHWGSNQVRANYGNTNADVATYRISVPDTAPFQTRALDTLHYFHGVNPFAKAYLTNMRSYGVESSANAIYHYWYQPGSKWGDAATSACGPPPGYVPGGPVANATSQGIPGSVSPPANQPAQKSYRDFNGVVGNPQNAWVVSEPGIYYQAAYVELLSRFAN
jgi:endoglucanase